MNHTNRVVSTILFWLLASAAAVAVAQTEFPPQAEVRAKMGPGAQNSWDRMQAERAKAQEAHSDAGPAARSGGLAQGEVTVLTTSASLQTDDQMLQQYRENKGRASAALAPAVVQVTEVSKSKLDGCSVVAEEAYGSNYNGKLSGYQRVFKCTGQPLVLLSDLALSHGRQVTLISQEDVNTRVIVRGVERGAVMKRVVSAKTGLGQSSLSWRDGDKVVTLQVNDSSDAGALRMKAIAASLI